MMRQSKQLRPTVFAADLPPMDGKTTEAARVSGWSCRASDDRKAVVSARTPRMAANDRGTEGNRGMH